MQSGSLLNMSNTIERNISNTTFVPVWIELRTELSIWFSVVMILCVLSTVFNVLLLAVILSSKKNRSGSGILTCNLLGALIIQSCISLPTNSVSYYDSRITTLRYCQIVGFIDHWSYYAVDWADCVIGLNRFVAICFPHFYLVITKKVFVFGMVTSAWLIPIIPIFLLRFRPAPPWNGCGIMIDPPPTPLIVGILGLYCPISLTAVCYVTCFGVIAHRLAKKRRQRAIANLIEKSSSTANTANATNHTNRNTAVTNKRYKSVLMFFVAYICYTICLLPLPFAAAFFPRILRSNPINLLVLRALVQIGYLLIPVSSVIFLI